MQKIPISEIFYSLQGEGTRMGVPSVFIRFWGCNLSCEFCDSHFSWDSNIEKPKHLPLDEVVQEVSSFSVKNLIFTGGEPMLQQKNIRAICDRIDPSFVEVETNGTIESDIDDIVDQYNVSPKFDFKNPIPLVFSEKTFWKFIIRNQDDIHMADEFCAERGILKEMILFQPEGKTKKELDAILPLASEAALARGVCLSPRLHILLWDDARSV